MSVSIEGIGSQGHNAEISTPGGDVITFENFTASKRMAEAIRGAMAATQENSVKEIFDDAA